MVKKKLLDKAVYILFPLVGTVFIVTLFAVFWNTIIQNSKTVLIVTGSIIVLFALLGYFNKKKFIRGFKKRI